MRCNPMAMVLISLVFGTCIPSIHAADTPQSDDHVITGSSVPTATTPGTFPSSRHVFVVMLENQDFSQVFPSGRATNCSSSGMPYLCGLAANNGNALQFYANVHGSLLDYLYNTSGATWTGGPSYCTGGGCAYSGAITGDNIVRAMTNAGRTWRAYFEGMPYLGYMGGDTGYYVNHHNPFRWYSDVAHSSVLQDNMYPFSQFPLDVHANSFRSFNYIVPNIIHDGDGTGSQSASALLLAADNWLKTNIGPLLATSSFQAGGDGVLMVVFDEGRVKGKSGDSVSDNYCSATVLSGCGGHVAFVMIGPRVLHGLSTTHTYHFQDMLHTIIHLLGMSDYMKVSGAADIALLPGVSY